MRNYIVWHGTEFTAVKIGHTDEEDAHFNSFPIRSTARIGEWAIFQIIQMICFWVCVHSVFSARIEQLDYSIGSFSSSFSFGFLNVDSFHHSATIIKIIHHFYYCWKALDWLFQPFTKSNKIYIHRRLTKLYKKRTRAHTAKVTKF